MLASTVCVLESTRHWSSSDNSKTCCCSSSFGFYKAVGRAFLAFTREGEGQRQTEEQSAVTMMRERGKGRLCNAVQWLEVALGGEGEAARPSSHPPTRTREGRSEFYRFII